MTKQIHVALVAHGHDVFFGREDLAAHDEFHSRIRPVPLLDDMNSLGPLHVTRSGAIGVVLYQTKHLRGDSHSGSEGVVSIGTISCCGGQAV